MLHYNALSNSSTKDVLVWDTDYKSTAEHKTFSLAHVNLPTLCLSPFAEPNSCCSDILTLGHNAVRRELCDMYIMYEAMRKLGPTLTHADVNMSTLWFRTMYNFTTQNVLQWQWQVFLPWASLRISASQSTTELICLITRHQGMLGLMFNTISTLQSNLSSQIEKGHDRRTVQRTLAQVSTNVHKFSTVLLAYFRAMESLVVPLLIRSDTGPFDRTTLFRELILHMLEAETAHIQLPILLRWMPASKLTTWLLDNAFDHMNRNITLAMYEAWHGEFYMRQHRSIVDKLVQKSKAAPVD